MEKVHGNIYTAICKIDSHWEFAVRLRELKPGLCNNIKGWEAVGGRFKIGDIFVPIANSY